MNNYNDIDLSNVVANDEPLFWFYKKSGSDEWIKFYEENTNEIYGKPKAFQVLIDEQIECELLTFSYDNPPCEFALNYGIIDSAQLLVDGEFTEVKLTEFLKKD